MSDYFGNGCGSRLWDCPRCYEAKLLGNKYYRMLDNVSERMMACSLGMTPDNYETEAKKLKNLSEKFDKIQKEFIGILSGRVKCGCEPKEILDDYLKAWGLT